MSPRVRLVLAALAAVAAGAVVALYGRPRDRPRAEEPARTLTVEAALEGGGGPRSAPVDVTSEALEPAPDAAIERAAAAEPWLPDEPPPPGTLPNRVLTHDGRPLPEAEVDVEHLLHDPGHDGSPLRRGKARLDASGCGLLMLDADAVGGAEMRVLDVTLPDDGPYQPRWTGPALTVSLLPEGNEPVTLRLLPVASFDVLVVTNDGEAAPDTSLTLYMSAGEHSFGTYAATGPEGVARFANLMCGQARLTAVHAETFATGSRELPIGPGTRRIVLALDPAPPAGALELAFEDESGASIEVKGSLYLRSDGEATEREHRVPVEKQTARLSLGRVIAGRYKLSFCFDELCGYESVSTLVEIAPEETAEATLRFERIGQLRGQVLGNGAPLPLEAGVSVERRGSNGMGAMLSVDENGRFEDEGVGSVELCARAFGFATAWRTVVLRPGAVEEVAIDLRRGAASVVRVRYRDGKPDSYREVRVWPAGRLDRIVTDYVRGDGAVAFHVDPPGAYQVALGGWIREVEAVEGAVAEVVFERAEDGPVATVEGDRTATILARVVDEFGRPFSAGRVTLRTADGQPYYGAQQQAMSSVRILRVEPGRYEATAEGEDLVRSRPVPVVAERGRTSEVLLALERPEVGWIVGRVVGMPADLTAHVRASSDEGTRGTDTGEEGRFRLGPLVAGEYRITVWGSFLEGATGLRVMVAPNEERELEIPIHALSRGRVELSGDGVIEAYAQPGTWSSTRQSRAAHVVADAGPGFYHVFARFEGDPDGVYRYDAGVDVSDGEVVSLTASPAFGTGRLRGYFVCPEGGAGDLPPGAIHIAGPSYRFMVNVPTRPFAIDRLPAGRYRIEREGAPFRELDLADGEDKDLGLIEVPAPPE